jgi:taurine dioxygenase
LISESGYPQQSNTVNGELPSQPETDVKDKQMNNAAKMEVRPFDAVGAEVRGVNLARLDAGVIDAIKSAWYQHDVLVFRNQYLSDDDLLNFSRNFGALDSPPNQGAGRKSPEGYPQVYVVSNVLDAKGEPIGALGDGEAAWHTDMSYAPQPPDASMLYSLEIPAEGGDTWFCSMKAALAKLPTALVERLRGLDIKHDGTYDSGGFVRKGLTATNDPRLSVGTAHPIITQHPQSGEHALYLGRRRNAYVVGLELAESEALLDEVWSSIDAAQYRHRWALGDLVMWDNRTTMHRRDAFDAEARRVMHRTQVKGSCAPRRAILSRG